MKAVFFDFDGTLTQKSGNIWRSIWSALGYELGEGSEYRQQLQDYLSHKISYQEWCDMTCVAYRSKAMTGDILGKLIGDIHLLHGVEETLQQLRENGYSLHIISGNIVDVIERVLGQNTQYFDSINANDFIFDANNRLVNIQGTNYDFEGKAKFIQDYQKTTGASATDLYFVGNGGNDEWAHLSGCHTICINPDDTDRDAEKWHYIREKTNDLRDILPYIIKE